MAALSSLPSRRGVLQSMISLGAGAMLPFATAAAVTKADEAARRIDVHFHFMPPRYMQEEHERLASYTHNLSSAAMTHWAPQQALETMDQCGIQIGIASVTTPGVWYGDVAAARRLSREWNEFAAKTISDHRGRFGLFAVVAPPDTEGALKEIEYALDTLKADGIGLLSNYDGKSLGDPAFDPVFAELNRRKAVVLVHPTAAPCCATLIPGLRPQAIEFGLDQTRTITSLVFNGTFAKNPDIRFIFTHGGGTVPFLADRIIRVVGEDKTAKERNPKGVAYELKKLHYDTASVTSAASMAAMLSFIPHANIVFGSDYPFVPPKGEVDDLAGRGLAAPLQRAIARENALRLLPRLRSI